MKLIATIGANKLLHNHEYIVNNKSYSEKVSFLALAHAFDVDDIVLIGTKQSADSIKELLNTHKNIQMIEVDSNDVSKVFQESLNHISKDTILDLTQGFRHYPMLTLLASVFLQNRPEKNIKDIFYAQIMDNDCKPYTDTCKYNFISLVHYLDIANMAKIINTFQNTLIVPQYEVLDIKFKNLINTLQELSKAMFSNNFQKSKEFANKTEAIVNEILVNKELTVLDEHLQTLKKELRVIQNLTREKESITLLNVSEYFLNKDILLHSITVLYESMVAFLDEKNRNKKCITYKDRNGNIKKADTYRRRNCLKKSLRNCKQVQNIYNCKEFSKALRKVDDLRNISAHAFTTSTHNKDLEDEIEKFIKLTKKVVSF